MPADLLKRPRQHDTQRLAGGSVTLHSHLPIERQTRVIGATWLNRHLIGGAAGVADKGFGGELRDALRQRSDFFVEQGLAERRAGGACAQPAGHLAPPPPREAARCIADETGLPYRQAVEGTRMPGVYRRDLLLSSGRFAMLDDDLGFTLAPWKPVTEKQLGRQLAATSRKALRRHSVGVTSKCALKARVNTAVEPKPTSSRRRRTQRLV